MTTLTARTQNQQRRESEGVELVIHSRKNAIAFGVPLAPGSQFAVIRHQRDQPTAVESDFQTIRELLMFVRAVRPASVHYLHTEGEFGEPMRAVLHRTANDITIQ